MRLLLKLLFLLIFMLPVILAGVLFLMLDDQPTINRAAEISPANIERAKRILDQNDPRMLKSGARRTISMNQRDLDLAANYLAHRYAKGSAQVRLTNGVAQIKASLPLPALPLGLFFNVDTALTENASLPRIMYLAIGTLSVPPWVAHWVLTRVLVRALGDDDPTLLDRVIKKVSLAEDRLALTYEWQSDLPDKVRTALFPSGEQARLRIYQEHLSAITRSLKRGKVSITELIAPLFQLAAERSQNGTPTGENRAAILVLTFYINGGGLDDILPAARNWPRPEKRSVTLSAREDFSKHFIISAALAAYAGSPLADAVGVYKEIADAKGGSGFSFNDIAADRAGTRFGERAIGSAASARTLQQQLSAAVSEKDIMPATADLPEFMKEAEFKRRFGGIDAPAYKEMIGEIDRRINALALYR